MSEMFKRAWRKLHGIEGDYADNPNDSGGETRFGVTEAVARRCGYAGEMRSLPLELAEQIAKEEYWNVLNLDAVGAIAGEAVAYELMDSAYHVGPQKAGRWLQDWLNALNLKQKLYHDLVVDSMVGEDTLRALNRYVAYRRAAGVRVLLRGLNSSQGAFYLDLAQRRQKDEEFLYGWMLNRVVI